MPHHNPLQGTSKNLLRCPIIVWSARSRPVYLFDRSRCLLNAKRAQANGSLRSNLLRTVFRGAFHSVFLRIHG